ncbi:MAG: family 78 glycoside hydrolase catalytic domain [Bacteroidales bacterium]|nr:family 78 glycoside hydrolase catalytic domain [Bacteroidales bacterium]
MKRIAFIVILLLNAVSIQAQQFIGCRTDSGWAETPMLRKKIILTEEPSYYGSVYLDVASIGYHEVYVNGMKVGDFVMQPAVSQLDVMALEVQYRIRKYLKKGENELLLWIGQGWGRVYRQTAAASATVWWSNTREIGDLAETDTSWETSPSGYSYTGSWQPMQFGGERYDARAKPEWRAASRVPMEIGDTVVTPDYTAYFFKRGIRGQEFKGNRIVDTLKFLSYEMEQDSSLVIDFGRVVTGWFNAVFSPMEAGTAVSMEYLDHRDAKPPFTETDIYISDGEGQDIFQNRFHMHAFRYVRIKGAGIVAARALQISAVNPKVGATFECSDSRLNAIHNMVKYTLSCLTFNGYMVDCPHIERMGYGGDGNSSTMTLQTLWDVRSTYANWMQAWADAMQPDGELPYVAPAFRTGGGPYWCGFIIKAPWRTCLNYGDPSLIHRHYGDMKRWLEYIEQHSNDYILQPWADNERHSWFLGDWAVPEGVDKGGESVLHASSCFISDCLADMVRMASMTGHPDDAQHYAAWHQNLNASIQRHFYHPETHTYANGTPLDQCYALLMGIPPDSITAAAVETKLINDCHYKYRDHIAAGLMGVPVFTEWCIRERQADLMATILRQPDYPGYLYMIENGATTTWESWDCGRPGKEDRSRVHNCYNGIGIWFYQALAGIRPDPEEPGYKHFFIDPQPCEGVEWVKATKPTPYGTIRVDIEKGQLKVEIPQGSTATVFPGTPKERQLTSGKHIIKL